MQDSQAEREEYKEGRDKETIQGDRQSRQVSKLRKRTKHRRTDKDEGYQADSETNRRRNREKYIHRSLRKESDQLTEKQTERHLDKREEK